jgi:hypothetical protein
LVSVTLATNATSASPEDVNKPREQAALALIQFPWQQLNYEIVFMAPRQGYRAMTFPAKHRIEIYARPADSPLLLAYDIAHELAHAIDLSFNTQETRQKWMKLRGINPATPWFGCDACSDFRTPSGDFAETFAFLLLGPGHFSGRIAPPPSSGQIPLLGAFFPKGFIPVPPQ